MKVNVLSRKLIKPCIPTPDKLRRYKISFIDENLAPVNVSVIIYYSSTEATKNPNILIGRLEESLTLILPQFYPLAGRYVKQDRLVDCNDSGAEFAEAEADCALHDLIGCPGPAMQVGTYFHLFPRDYGAADEITDPILSIQVTKFKCGGLAIGFSVSHRIFDASSLRTFVVAWSNTNCSELGENTTVKPSFDAILLFPGKNVDPVPHPPTTRDPTIVLKSFIFNKAAITSLREKIKKKNNSNHAPSRVRVVCAVIAKALKVVDQVKHRGQSRSCLLMQAVNIRGRTIPPLPKYSCGNLVVLSHTCINKACIDHMEIQDYFNMLGDGTNKTISDCAELLSVDEEVAKRILFDPGEEIIETIKHGNINIIIFSDWSKLGFYEADFGWGKPVWASVDNASFENLVLLMDNKEGEGIEAWIHLHQEYMPFFEQDEDIKLFTTKGL